MKNVLFVCMGNICRSPAGEAVFRQLAAERQIPVEVDSAGTHGYHVGSPADPRMLKAARQRGYEVTSRARQVELTDLDPSRYQLVLAMDRQNLKILHSLAAGDGSHVRLFSDYLDAQWPADVPDPYYGGDDGFSRVLDMLEAGCPAVMDELSSIEN